MATLMYLEQYLDSLENLPADIQRNFNLMRDLDQRTQDLLKEINKLSSEYLNNVRNYSAEMKKKKLEVINQKFSKCHEYGDDKVQLANQTYEMVDKHIRRLDSELARFEAELRDQAFGGKSDPESTSSKSKTTLSEFILVEVDQLGKSGDKKRKRKTDDESEDSQKKKRKSQGTTMQPLPMPPGLGPLALSLGQPADVLDMPVDPNEPTYCLCHQVSYGEMIGCDNTDCPIEWFHFPCVGLTSKPKGKWFCPRCIEEKKRIK